MTGTAPAVDWIPTGCAARGGGPAHCDESNKPFMANTNKLDEGI